MFFRKKQTNMEAEIIEQTKIIPYILMKYINPDSGEIKIDLPQNVRKIILVASGSSYHCARFAVDLLEKFSGIESRAIYSSEFLLKMLFRMMKTRSIFLLHNPVKQVTQ
jgi:glucosamine 6-phosphate synthetase-like amidotransferase/phosphosugar isomerase protein